MQKFAVQYIQEAELPVWMIVETEVDLTQWDEADTAGGEDWGEDMKGFFIDEDGKFKYPACGKNEAIDAVRAGCDLITIFDGDAFCTGRY